MENIEIQKVCSKRILKVSEKQVCLLSEARGAHKVGLSSQSSQ